MEQRSVTVIENISSHKDGLSFLISPWLFAVLANVPQCKAIVISIEFLEPNSDTKVRGGVCPDPEGKVATVSWAPSSVGGAGHLSSRSSKEEGTQGCEKDREEIVFSVSGS